MRRVRALALAVTLVAWNHWFTPRIPQGWNPLPQAMFGTAVAVIAGRRPGLSGRELRSGLVLGSVAAAVVAAAVAAGAAVPPVRAGMAGRELPDDALRWLLLRIPFGTVWSEEVAFRGALLGLGVDVFGPTGGRLLHATAFGLSHIADARGSNEPVIPTVVATGVAGWVFGWLFERSGSLAAPLLAHLSVNESGAAAVLTARRRVR